MVVSNMLNNNENLYKSKLSTINDIANLQIGKTYVIINTDKENAHDPFKHTIKHRIVQILSVTPKLDYSKISNTITFDSMNRRSDMYFNDDEKKNYSFKKYVCEDRDFGTQPYHDELKYGWMYFEVEYMDIHSKQVQTDIIYYTGYDMCIENTKSEPGTRHYKSVDGYCDRFFTSDIFEYDYVVKKEKSRYTGKTEEIKSMVRDKAIVDAINKIKKTELHDYIVGNFRTFLAQNILTNNEVIPDDRTIVIDGVTWYNGFFNAPGGVVSRDYLFYDYIPNGWRLPTLEELTSMLKKHPLLRKELDPKVFDKYMHALRNNAGMEGYINSYFAGKTCLDVMVKDSNDYMDEKCYFPCELTSVELATRKVNTVSPCERSWNSGYKPYLIMLVKMSAEELQKQNEWAAKVIDETYKYETIDSIYKEYGVDDIDDITGITFDITIGDKVKTFERKKGNQYLYALKKAISDYIGNINALSATHIDISFTGESGNGALGFDATKDCNMREFLTKVTPLLNSKLCWKNVNTVKGLTTNSRYDDDSIRCVRYKYEEYRIPLNMYFYTKNSLELIGVEHDYQASSKHEGSWSSWYSYYATTAYMSKLVLHMADGKDITINEMPVCYFNQSKLYLNELSNDDNYNESVKKIRKQVIKWLEKDDKSDD